MRRPMIGWSLPSRMVVPRMSSTDCETWSCTAPSLPMSGRTLSWMPMSRCDTVEVTWPVCGAMVAPVMTGRDSPTKIVASLLWVVVTAGTERTFRSPLRGVVVRPMVALRSLVVVLKPPWVALIWVLFGASVVLVVAGTPFTAKPPPVPPMPTSLPLLTVRPRVLKPLVSLSESFTSTITTSMRTCGRTMSTFSMSSWRRRRSSLVPETTTELLRISGSTVRLLLNSSAPICEAPAAAAAAAAEEEEEEVVGTGVRLSVVLRTELPARAAAVVWPVTREVTKVATCWASAWRRKMTSVFVFGLDFWSRVSISLSKKSCWSAEPMSSTRLVRSSARKVVPVLRRKGAPPETVAGERSSDVSLLTMSVAIAFLST